MRETLVKLSRNDRAIMWPSRVLLFALVGLPAGVFLYRALLALASGVADGTGAVLSWEHLFRSIAVSAVVACMATAAGIAAGLIAGRLSGRAQWACILVFAMPLAVAPSVHAYLWRNMALSAGLLQGLFVEGGDKTVNYAGAIWSGVSARWTIPALAAMAVSAGPGRRFELEARPFVSAQRAVRKILLPAMRPVACAAAGVVFVLTFAEYGAPLLWQVTTYPVHVQALYSSLLEVDRAAAASLVPAAVAVALAVGVFLSVRRAARSLDVTRVEVDADALWRPRFFAKAALCLFVAVLVAMPVGFAVFYMLTAGVSAADLKGVFGHLGRGMVLALVSTGVAALLAGLIAGSHWVRSRRWRNAFAGLAVAGFVLPAAGMAIAIKEIAGWQFVPRAFGTTSAAYGYALAGRFLAVPLVLAVAVLAGVDRHYVYLSRLSGSKGIRHVASVALPLAAPVLVMAWVASAVLAVGELQMGMMLSAPGSPPVSVDLFNLMHYARQGEAFAVALAMMLGTAAVIGVLLPAMGNLWKRYLSTA